MREYLDQQLNQISILNNNRVFDEDFDLPELTSGASTVTSIVAAEVERPNPRPQNVRNPIALASSEEPPTVVNSPHPIVISEAPVASVSKR